MVERCEAILQQVEKHASSIKTMHDHMREMIEHNKKIQLELEAIQQQDVQKQMIKLASKAAKKAAKKSIAKARIREALKDEKINQSEDK